MDAFEKFDKNKDGSLGLKEIQRLVEALNVSMSPGQVKKKFKVSKEKRCCSYLIWIPVLPDLNNFLLLLVLLSRGIIVWESRSKCFLKRK